MPSIAATEVPPLVSALGAVVGMMGLLGVAYAVFTSAKVQKTVELYKLENEAQGKRIDTLEKEKVTWAERLAVLERENGILEDLATGKTFIGELSREIHEAESQRMAEHKAMTAVLEKTNGALEEIKDTLAEMWQGMVRFFGSATR